MSGVIGGQKLHAVFRHFPKKTKMLDLIHRWHIYKGDTVQVMAGKCKGQQGIVTEVLRKKNRIVIGGVNMVNSNVLH